MMNRRYLLPLLAACYHAGLSATELVQWQRLPLPVVLHTGHERVIFVNRNVRVGYPAALDDKLRIQSSGGTVYLLARDDFSRTRLQLVDMDSGELILLDISAAAGDELEPVELRYGEAVYRNDKAVKADEEEASTSRMAATTGLPVPVVLTRYAAQSLYAPLRTVEPLNGITPVPVRLPAVVSTLLPTEAVTAAPLAAWQQGALTVTAVKLQNQRQARIDLDPRALQGQFLTATFQHRWLGAKGTPEDTTVVYLVTEGGADTSVIPEPAAPDKEGK
ncbi:TIGR03749 family integrating conjugative element protein [Buttiauxella selenatireducens]|uniref:TIGR03749 family integrating conjugative element protein n=1 Tax=Buttiauxella selenatireducens TaxID=3073902 RepID=A0ABY9S4Q8_9ENTR|nr:TIGR03749 family integrating conjugative element protein [Buttiauxella sp. R73]WMY72481.1 TIGR03749 family integrating conjugative element protein [Buttiauxella sp. R73]